MVSEESLNNLFELETSIVLILVLVEDGLGAVHQQGIGFEVARKS